MEKRLIDYDDLTTKGKIDHIWEYYKLHIIGGIIGVLFLSWIVNHYILNPPPDVGLDISLLTYVSNQEEFDALEEGLNENVLDNNEELTAIVEFFSRLDSQKNDPNMEMATMTKIMGKGSMQEFDIVFFADDEYTLFSNEGGFMPLESFIEAGEIQVDESRYVRGTDIGMEDSSIVMIDVSGMEGFNRLLGDNDKNYFTIYVDTQHPETVHRATDYIFDRYAD